MKIKFQNLGSIKEAELDLRPLTVIIGPNNFHKTELILLILFMVYRNNLIAILLMSIVEEKL